jgi:hypothetical protein
VAESFISLRVSKDGGHTWTAWKTRSLGETGDFLRPAVWRRLGNGRHFTFDVRADGAPDILSASILDAMGQWQEADITGPAYADESRPWTAQDTDNYLVVNAERPGGRSARKLRGTPGTRLFANVGDGPIRAARDVEGKLFVVSGEALYRVGRDTSVEEIGTIPGTGRCTITHNQEGGGNKVVVSNQTRGYTYDTITETFAQIDDEAFPGALTVDYLDSYILGIEPQRRYAFHSDLANAREYSSIDRLESEGAPDRLVGMLVDHGQWWLFGERTIEVFTNTGAATGTFQRIDGSTIDRGLAGTFAVAKLDNSVWWVGEDGGVYRANGYTPARMSTHPVEQALRVCDLSQCFLQTYEDAGHKVLYVTCPDGYTWAFDVASGEWTRRSSFGLNRWRMSTLTKWAGVWIMGDYQTGTLYQVDWSLKDDAGQPLVGRRTTGALSNGENRFSVNGVRVLCDTASRTGVPVGVNAIIDPLVMFNRLPAGIVGETVEHPYRATGGVRPYVFSIALGALPDDLDMDADGLVTGTYTLAQEYAWRPMVTDAAGNTAYLDEGIDGPLGIDGPEEFVVGSAPPVLMTDVRAYEGDRAAMTVLGSDIGWPAGINVVAVSPDGMTAAGSNIGSSAGTYFQLRKFNTVTEAWDVLDDPVFMPSNGPEGMAWHPSGEYLLLHGTNINTAAEDLVLYRQVGDTFTKLADPEFPSTNVNGIAWDSSGQRLGFGLASSARPVGVYDFSADLGVLYNLRECETDLSTSGGTYVSWMPGVGSRYLAWASADDKFGVARVDTNLVENAVTEAVDSEAGIFFDASGSYLFVIGKTAPDYVTVWQFQGSIIGSETLVQETPDPAQPASIPLRGSLSSDKAYLALACSSANAPTVYEVSDTLPPVLTQLAAQDDAGAAVQAVAWTNYDP